MRGGRGPRLTPADSRGRTRHSEPAVGAGRHGPPGSNRAPWLAGSPSTRRSRAARERTCAALCCTRLPASCTRRTASLGPCRRRGHGRLWPVSSRRWHSGRPAARTGATTRTNGGSVLLATARAAVLPEAGGCTAATARCGIAGLAGPARQPPAAPGLSRTAPTPSGGRRSCSPRSLDSTGDTSPYRLRPGGRAQARTRTGEGAPPCTGTPLEGQARASPGRSQRISKDSRAER